ncbi:glycosyltransferase family 2 protein [Paenibacillus sp. Soil787]|uniref:glycosyltransferase family 2 protein n=1 Tax=Paenibacillus sp. Soil787 TaxID=1736411 RepID=UPI0006F3C7DD|nr:glycosyltransferase family 2 protein [Paenibacillus sp. Soil787]KRF39107.1 glycosyl transferase family 2 [Paenibacillus sp. Soil787]
MKILAIVPAYNEEESIKQVIADLNENFVKADVLIINDCSKDSTAAIAIKAGAKVITLPCNLGIGGAVQTGFIYANSNNYDIAFQFDGDGQHLAIELNKLLEPILILNADMVIGSRFLDSKNYKPSFFRSLGITYFQFINSTILKQKLTDTTSGFRAYNKKAIKYLASNYPQDYPEVETIIIMKKAGFTIKELSVTMRERLGGRSSINGFKPIYYMVKVTFSILINLLRKHPKKTSEEMVAWN